MKKYLYKIFKDAGQRLDYLKNKNPIFSVPSQKEHGDYSTNVALTLTKELKKNPRQIAQEIIDNFEYDENIISKIEQAGPGFINFFFTNNYAIQIVKNILDEKEDFGKSERYKGKKANVEFVSANPTGPLTVGHGRNAVVGDTVSNLLEQVGYEVDREYYFNNAGRQMRVLGDSVKLRYLELLGDKINFPDEYYQGDYIKAVAQKVKDDFGASLKDEDSEGKFKEYAEQEIFADIKNTLDRIGINFEIFFNEKNLYEEKKIEELLKYFEVKNLSYKKDEALWLKFSELGRDEDKVIVKSTGEPTYRLPDIAYHKTKYDRGYDLIVDLFGSDHSATYPDVIAGLKALGYDPEKMKVLIHQFVTILDKGEVVKMSTRKANFITLDELIDDVGADVVRYFFAMRNLDSHLNFDLDLAKKQSDENPVFYLQYAHARISSIMKMTKEEKLSSSTENLNLLEMEEEQDLAKKLYRFEEEVLYAAENFEPQKIAIYLEELAAMFHRFYTKCRIIGSEEKLAQARIALALAVQQVIKNGLGILGVKAPDRM